MIAVLQAKAAGLWTRSHIRNNVVAGIVVGVVALPLAMAFAIASAPRAGFVYLDRRRSPDLAVRRNAGADFGPHRRLHRRAVHHHGAARGATLMAGVILVAHIQRPATTLILRMGSVPFIEATDINALEEMVGDFKRHGASVLLVELRPNVRYKLERAGVSAQVGE
jgi:MFS superfamily sulfate permease-like transporter